VASPRQTHQHCRRPAQRHLGPADKPRTSSIEDQHGNLTQIPDARPFGQRLHDGLDEACGRLLKSADQPVVGGVPASVIVTVQLEDLLAKAGLAETNDGTVLTSEQLLRIADQAEIGPPSSTTTTSP
jgi:hypothetical protein